MKQPLDKKYVHQLMFSNIVIGFVLWLSILLPISISLMAVSMVVAGILLLILVPVVYVGVVYLLSRLWWKNYTYELQSEAFVKHFGVISLRNTSIPYERIQNININRPLISRIFGLSQLHIQTAGNSGVAGAEGILPGVSSAVAEKLRDDLIHRSRGVRVATEHPDSRQPSVSDHSGGL